MGKDKNILGLILILIGILGSIIFMKTFSEIGIILIIIGIFSLLNKNEDRIEKINYRKIKRRK